MEPSTKTVQFAVLGDPSRKCRVGITRRTGRCVWLAAAMSRSRWRISAEKRKPFAFGQHPRGGEIGPQDFVTWRNPAPSIWKLSARGLEVHVDVELI